MPLLSKPVLMVRPTLTTSSSPSATFACRIRQRPPDGERWTVVVHGADHPGIVHGIASVLAGLGVNIVDLTTRVSGTPPLYAMVIEATLPNGLDAGDLDRRLTTESRHLGVECTLHPSEADIL